MIRRHTEDCVAERGASSVEYALIMSLIAIVIIGGVVIFGNSTAALFTDSCTSIAQAQGSAC